MTIVIDQVRGIVEQVVPAGPRCLVCGRTVKPSDPHVRLRGHGRVHRACATYRMRKRPEGEGRLGYPPRG